ncbi:hypothetical protein TNCV_3512211 [Trichonephila clavipes]|nr:hypothetical protein TNCV_3512211 [Trichonephila clavipes]
MKFPVALSSGISVQHAPSIQEKSLLLIGRCLLLPSALVRVVCRSDRFSQFRVWLRPRRVLIGFASSCCPAPPQFWASFSCWPPSLFAIHSEQKRPLAVARDRSYFRLFSFLSLYGDHAPASSTTSRIIMSESSDYMELSPTKFDQVSVCEKLRDTVTGISALHLSIHGMDGRSPSPGNSFMDMYISGKQAMIRRKEMVSELKTLPPCTISDCPDHKIPSTSVEEENNFVPSPPVNENKIENKIKINSKSKKKFSKKRKQKGKDSTEEFICKGQFL